jgi:hypothetical protein
VTFSHDKSYALILTKMVCATFWATFSETHLVTLSILQPFLFSVQHVQLATGVHRKFQKGFFVNLLRTRAARFLLVQYTKTGKIYLPNNHEMNARWLGQT